MAMQTPIRDVVKNNSKNYKANLIGARVGRTTPNLATLVFKFLGSGKIVIWQIRDTKWEKPKPAEEAEGGAKKVDYDVFGKPREEFLQAIKNLTKLRKEVALFSSMQSTKDALGNGPTQFFDSKGEDFIAWHIGGDFKASLKY